jgi:hypothetical protein
LVRAGLGRSVCLLGLCSCAACEFPLSASKYEVAAGPEEQASGPSEPRLLAAFSANDPACVAELESKCPANVRQCATTPGCTDFTECVRAHATPAAETSCLDVLGTSLEARWSYETLRACWAEQYAICDVGNDFRCAGQYEAPNAERSEVTLSHTIKYLDQPDRPADFLVRICGFLSDCSTPLNEIATDPSGQYTVTIGVGTEPGGPGSAWAGYRLVESPGIDPTRVESNVPIWGVRTEVTRVLDKTQQQLLAALVGEAHSNAVFVQALDCQSAPAAGVAFELPLSTAGRVRYVAGVDAVATDGTGAAAIYDLEPERLQQLVATLPERAGESARAVATWHGFQPSGHVMYVKLLPDPR